MAQGKSQPRVTCLPRERGTNGVPAVLTNWWPPAMRPWHASDIFLPKLPRRLAHGRYLTLAETLREPLADCHSPRYLATHDGVHVEDNEKVFAVAEMLLRLDGNAGHDADVAELRARADGIYQGHGHFGMARLGPRFSPPPSRPRRVICVGSYAAICGGHGTLSHWAIFPA